MIETNIPIYSHPPVQRGRQPEQPPRHSGAKRPTAENHRPCTKAIMATSEAFVPLFNDGMYIVSPVVETFQLIRLILRKPSLLHHPREGFGRPRISARHLLSYQLHCSVPPHLNI